MPGDPPSGSKVGNAPDREIGKVGENRGKVLAHRDLLPTAAFHDRENRCNLRSCQWAGHLRLRKFFSARTILLDPHQPQTLLQHANPQLRVLQAGPQLGDKFQIGWG